MLRWFRAALVAASLVVLACGIKGPPRPPAEEPAPQPMVAQPQTPMTQTPDAGCQSCAERTP